MNTNMFFRIFLLIAVFIGICYGNGNKINVGKNRMVELTEIPFGYMPGHEAFAYLNHEEATAVTKVLDESHLDMVYDNALYVRNMFQNSTLFKELTPRNANSLMALGKPFVIVLLCNCPEDSQQWELPDLEEALLERKFHEKFVFLYSFPEATKQFQLVHRFSLKKLPSLIIDNIPAGPNNEKFVYKDFKGDEGFGQISMERFIKFLSDYIHNTLPMTLLSEPHHVPPKKGEIWHITGDDFRHIVMENEKDVLVLVYSPFCQACHWMQNVFNDMAKHFQNVDTVLLGTFDKTKNDFPVRGIKVRVFPTILLFPGKDKHNWIDFRTFSASTHVPWDQEGFTKFLEKKGSFTLDKKQIIEEKEPDFDHDMTILHPDNFKDVVYDNSKDVFLMIWAFWCPHCTRAKPAVIDLASKYKIDDGVVIAAVESKHHHLIDRLQRGYPTFLLFRKGNKANPIQYMGTRTAAAFSEWIEKNRVSPSKLPQPEMFHPTYNGPLKRWYKNVAQEAYFEQTGEDLTWYEYVNGKKSASFKEINFDPETQEAIIYDSSRTLYVKLTKTDASWSSVQDGDWHVFDKGSWFGK